MRPGGWLPDFSPTEWREMGPTAPHLYLRDTGWSVDTRRDEDPRHKWCPLLETTGSPWPCHPNLFRCHRCDGDYLALLSIWMEREAPGWLETGLKFDECDPKRRSLDKGQDDFENSICEGERRVAAGRWVP